jgi:hypothetical protein
MPASILATVHRLLRCDDLHLVRETPSLRF